MKHLLLIGCSLLLWGCASNPFHEFYRGMTDAPQQPLYDSSVVGTDIYSTNDFDRDIKKLQSYGYVVIGNAQFNAGASLINEKNIRKQATEIGAHVVLYASKYSHTVSGATPLTLPTTTTSYTSGNAYAYGSGGSASAYGNSVTTTYGTQTTYIPYSVDKYEVAAVFLAKAKNRLGALVSILTDVDRKKLGTNYGVVVQTIVQGSNAFKADILPGDVIIKINETKIDSVESYQQIIYENLGKRARFQINRNRKTLNKIIPIANPA